MINCLGSCKSAAAAAARRKLHTSKTYNSPEHYDHQQRSGTWIPSADILLPTFITICPNGVIKIELSQFPFYRNIHLTMGTSSMSTLDMVPEPQFETPHAHDIQPVSERSAFLTIDAPELKPGCSCPNTKLIANARYQEGTPGDADHRDALGNLLCNLLQPDQPKTVCAK